jgi:SAM-dependent methyltransferase
MDLRPASAAGQANPELAWALALFRRSLLKQDKFRRIKAMTGDTRRLACLDIGSNNGVISWLLRQGGGIWVSADLDEQAVASISRVLGEKAWRIDDTGTPFADDQFDAVVIIDFLEHVEGDAAFIGEVKRILKPGGLLVANVPHVKPGSLLNHLRHRLGLTDELHGHVRPGYSLAGLRELLGPDFALEEARTYSKFFSEAVDTALSWMYLILQRRKQREVGSPKGIVLHQDDREQNRKELLLMGALYPLLWLVSRLDYLLPLAQGYKLVARARYLAKP